ncbi:hypothetical protein NKH70_26775 [Mesorhizobium sp. M0991]|uniref:hypothetical protein n=1 Tax=Mesorhizobium sp. M0991 TaxID=2957043 RepID=UPI003335D05B
MTAFKHPAFAKLSPKIARGAKELQQIEEYLSAHGSEMSLGEWGAVAAVSLAVHNVYNGIEDILLSLSNDIDGLVPQGLRCARMCSIRCRRKLQASARLCSTPSFISP